MVVVVVVVVVDVDVCVPFGHTYSPVLSSLSSEAYEVVSIFADFNFSIVCLSSTPPSLLPYDASFHLSFTDWRESSMRFDIPFIAPSTSEGLLASSSIDCQSFCSYSFKAPSHRTAFATSSRAPVFMVLNRFIASALSGFKEYALLFAAKFFMSFHHSEFPLLSV